MDDVHVNDDDGDVKCDADMMTMVWDDACIE